MKYAYITDSGTGSSKKELENLGIHSLPLQISIDNNNYNDLENLSLDDIINNLKLGKKMATSLPSIGLIEELFKQLKAENVDKIYAVPICKGLSGTINAFEMMAKQYDLDITCIDTYVTAYLELYCIELIKEGIEKNIAENIILSKVEEVIASANTILLPKDLNHLAKSGRMTPLALRLANLFNIKPILKINKSTNGRIDVIEKVRTFKKAMGNALKIMQKEIDSDDFIIYTVDVDNQEDLDYFYNLVKAEFLNNDVIKAPLCGPVALHTGLGCIAIQYFKKIK